VETLLQQLGFEGRDAAGCAKRARAELPGLPRDASRANVAALGLYCALEGNAGPELTGPLEAAAKDALGPPRIVMPDDDRSGLYEVLVSARKAAGDAAGARALATEWLAALETAAAASPTPAARAVLDAHRLVAAMECGQTERALAPLERSEREWPDDYNPPARLAVAYLDLKRFDEALAASDRALAKVAGPRRVRVLADRGDILLGRGERGAAREAFAAAKTLALETPEAQRSRTQLARVEQRLAELARP
jgi:tetratricopeptide (TPR) repeat protein